MTTTLNHLCSTAHALALLPGYRLTPFVALFLAACLVSAAIVLVAWSKRPDPLRSALMWLMVSLALWSGFAGIEAAATTMETKWFWSKMAYLGTCTTPPLLLVVAIHLCRLQTWLRPGVLVLLFSLPVTTILLAATNQWHQLVWTGMSPPSPVTNLSVYHHGVWFWPGLVLPSYACGLAATILIVQRQLRTRHPFRRRSLYLLAGALVPWAGNITYIAGASPVAGLDLTPLAFTVSGMLYGTAILRHQLLDLIPVARDTLIERMEDGVVVDHEGRIVDLNPAACQLLAVAEKDAIGRDFAGLLPDHHGIRTALAAIRHTDDTLTRELTMGNRFLQLRATVLQAGQSGSGRLFVLRDVTGLVEARQRLKATNVELQERIRQAESLARQITRQAALDPLTGLFNRGHLDEVLEREIHTALRQDRPLAVAIIDIDHFKRLNDRHGHQAGDKVLRELAALIQQVPLQGQIACRFGGEEFVLVIPGLSSIEVVAHLEGLRQTFARQAIRHQGRQMHATFSAGVSSCPRDGETAARVFRAADASLYAAKAAGRNCVVDSSVLRTRHEIV